MKIIIPCKIIPWNQLIGKHWSVVKRVKDELAKATLAELIKNKIKPHKTFPCTVHFHIRWKEKRRHDIDSVCVKHALDQIIRMEIVPDDSLEYIERVIYTGETGCERDEVEITIE